MRNKKQVECFQAIVLICILNLSHHVWGSGQNGTVVIPEYRNTRREPILTRAPPVTKLGDPSITLTVPARKVCHKGSFDSKYNSCTYIDKDDEAVPIYKVRIRKEFLSRVVFCLPNQFPCKYTRMERERERDYKQKSRN